MKKAVIIGLLIIIAVAGGLILYFSINDNEEDNNTVTDAMKFKEEYEELNGKTNSSGRNYMDLSIDKNNIVKYVTESEALDIIKNKTGVIYFGFPSCPWCRASVPVLLNAMESKNMGVLYYLNILDIRSTIKLDDDDKVVVEKKGTEGYYKLLEALDSELDDFKLENSKGKMVSSGEKRLYAPTFVFVKDGKIVGSHVGTVDSQSDPYIQMTNEQKEELNDIFIDLINKISDTSCSDNDCQ